MAWMLRQALGVVVLGLAVAMRAPWGMPVLIAGTTLILAGVASDAAAVARRAGPSYQPRWFNRGLVYLAVTAVALVAGLAWRLLVDGKVAEPIRLRTDTMAPTFLAGDRVYAVARRGSPVHRGDIVVYQLWETQYVKRIVGAPGDTLAMERGQLLVGGRPVAEPYAQHVGESESVDARFAWQRPFAVGTRPPRPAPTLATWGPLVVPAGRYFVLGDNRGQSVDSRYHGFVPDSAIVGRPVLIYFSRDPVLGHIRWRRIGREGPDIAQPSMVAPVSPAVSTLNTR